MRRGLLFVLVVLVAFATAQIGVAQPSPNARAHCQSLGGDCGLRAPSAGPLEAVGPVIWDNGSFNGVNGLSSERATVISGTGGPEGDHASTVADDFQLATAADIVEVQVCMLVSAEVTTAEMYIYTDASGSPTLPVNTPLVGAPTTGSIVSTTYVDETTFCPGAFGFIGRAFLFQQPISLAAGTYWLAAVGQDAGAGRAFWASSTPADPLAGGVWGSTVFGAPYWSSALTGADIEDFAFRLVGPPRLTAAIPTLGLKGLVALAALIAAVALVALRLRR